VVWVASELFCKPLVVAPEMAAVDERQTPASFRVWSAPKMRLVYILRMWPALLIGLHALGCGLVCRVGLDNLGVRSSPYLLNFLGSPVDPIQAGPSATT
jgi:hypothetical protein